MRGKKTHLEFLKTHLELERKNYRTSEYSTKKIEKRFKNNQSKDMFTKAVFDFFNERPTKNVTIVSSIPYHFITKSNEMTYQMNIDLMVLSNGRQSIDTYHENNVLPLKISMQIESSSHVYSTRYFYTTAKPYKTDVWSTYKCTGSCGSCYTDLERNVGRLFKQDQKTCWAGINNWACEGKYCWTIDTGTICCV